MKTKYIKKFIFDRASYTVGSDDLSLTLKVNYKKKSFALKNADGKIPEELRREISTIAKELIIRKHEVNFAGKE
jgi:hypothetical protein